MAKRLKEKHLVLDLIMTSTAVRTLTTAQGIAKVLGYEEHKIKGWAELYHASPEKILGLLNQVNDHYDVVMLVGHNPGLTDFVNALSPVAIDNVPTCGIAAFHLNIDTWREMEMKEETLLFYDYPKK